MGSVKNAESSFKIRMFIKFTRAWVTIKANTINIKCISILAEI